MNGVDVLVVTSAVAFVTVMAWFFVCPKTVRSAALRGGTQITVKGG